MRRSRLIKIAAIAVLGLAVGCTAGDEEPVAKTMRTAADWAAELGPPEEFIWDDQPISFSPPPTDWERQRQQSGGLMGARFVKYVAGGQAMHFAEYTAVGKRDRCSELEELLRDLDELSQRKFSRRLQLARPYLHEPFNAAEKMFFDAANDRLDEARDAFRAGDLPETRDRISAALWDLRSVAYSLDEVAPPRLFTGEGYQSLGKIDVSEAKAGNLNGKPSMVIGYLFAPLDRERLFHGRRVYIAHNNRLFEASFQGGEEYLPLFEAILESISFPEGPCKH